MKSHVWWYKFTICGKLVRESSKSTRKTVAVEAERVRRRELEVVFATGQPADEREARIRSVAEVVKTYQAHYGLNHRLSSVTFSRKRLAYVVKHLGSLVLPDLTEAKIRGDIEQRLADGASGRTVNMEIGELSRAVGKPWRYLWPGVRKLEERKDIGRAITSAEEIRLFEAAMESRTPIIGTFLRLALQTGMRAGEITSLKWQQVCFEKRLLVVGKAKTAAGTGRVIPLNDRLFSVLDMHRSWFEARFKECRPEWHVFPYGSPAPSDPTRAATTLATAWENVRDRAGVACRFHDLRHTAISRMAEAGVSEMTIMAIAGHVSRAMLERYSHISVTAKRRAVDALMDASIDRVSNGMGKESVKESSATPRAAR